MHTFLYNVFVKSTCCYKYLQRDHAKRILEDGLFRIGTLFEYRDTDLHGVEIGDALEGRLIAHEEEEMDCYLYSLSESFDPHAMKRMGFDTCLRITDSRLFFIALTDAFLRKNIVVDPVQFGRCVYVDQSDFCSGTEDFHPFFLKHARYSYQKEIRAFWKPKDLKIQPLFLSAPEAVRFCDVHSVAIDKLVNF